MIRLKNISKTYRTKQLSKRALDGVSLSLDNTGMVFILGKSGSGKTTLLHILGGLDKDFDGELIIDERSSKGFAEHDYDNYRNNEVGFIFQELNLMDDFNVSDNIALSLELQNEKR